ncbi:MAG: calcium/sodium antiporter, partial [Ilumatobacteraceae bacterium]
MSVVSILYIAVGITSLVVGAEWLVRGASRIASRTGLSNVVIGLTVVAFGTSAPELAVGLGDVLRGNEDAGEIAVGNVIGSNIANILFALGLAAAVGGALIVAQRIVRIDVPIMIGVSVLFLLFALDGGIGRVDGLVLTTGLVAYVTWTVLWARRRTAIGVELQYEEALAPARVPQRSVWNDITVFGVGLVLLVIGAQGLVTGAGDIAADLGVSDLLIGLTVVAIGTSLPEVATTIVAALRGQRDLAVGNAIGSNLFNLLGVLGITALVSP